MTIEASLGVRFGIQKGLLWREFGAVMVANAGHLSKAGVFVARHGRHSAGSVVTDIPLRLS